MYKVKLFTIGKNKEAWLQEALSEYTQRLQSAMSIEWILAKDTEKLKQLLEKESAYLCLDPKGKLYSSEEFARFFLERCEKGGCRLSLVIGEAEGIPETIKKKASHLLSLSPLTFTHQITRLILLEQLYRTMEIHKGSGYHK